MSTAEADNDGSTEDEGEVRVVVGGRRTRDTNVEDLFFFMFWCEEEEEGRDWRRGDFGSFSSLVMDNTTDARLDGVDAEEETVTVIDDRTKECRFAASVAFLCGALFGRWEACGGGERVWCVLQWWSAAWDGGGEGEGLGGWCIRVKREVAPEAEESIEKARKESEGGAWEARA